MCIRKLCLVLVVGKRARMKIDLLVLVVILLLVLLVRVEGESSGEQSTPSIDRVDCEGCSVVDTSIVN